MGAVYGTAGYYGAGLLMLIGLHGMLARPNLLRKLMAMNVLQTAVILFYLELAQKTGGAAPVLSPGALSGVPADFVNPLPHALMLTAIVVGVSTNGVALALIVSLFKRYGTLEEDELYRRLRDEP